MQILAEHIRAMENKDEWHGFGYLGACERTGAEDVKLAQAATKLGLDVDEVFEWANSTYGRHFMANAPQTIRAYKEELLTSLPLLKSNDLAYYARRAALGHGPKAERNRVKRQAEIKIAMLREEADRLERALAGERW
jgi:hypothetical protein